MDMDSFREHERKGFEAGNIKVHVVIRNRQEGDPAQEHLWARPVTPTTAKVGNIPFYTDAFCMGDLVEHADGEIIGVIERAAWTFRAAYRADPSGDVKAAWKTLRDYFEGHDIHVESAYPGLFSLAVPRDIGPERLMEIALACPTSIEGICEPEEHDRFKVAD